MPEETNSSDDDYEEFSETIYDIGENKDVVDIFSIHSKNENGIYLTSFIVMNISFYRSP